MLIDTHIWIWWVNGDPQLKPGYEAISNAAQPTGIRRLAPSVAARWVP